MAKLTVLKCVDGKIDMGSSAIISELDKGNMVVLIVPEQEQPSYYYQAEYTDEYICFKDPCDNGGAVFWFDANGNIAD